jgi:hypothetical protein
MIAAPKAASTSVTPLASEVRGLKLIMRVFSGRLVAYDGQECGDDLSGVHQKQHTFPIVASMTLSASRERDGRSASFVR